MRTKLKRRLSPWHKINVIIKSFRAFEKDLWYVEHSPFKLRVEERLVFIDVQLWRGLNGNRRRIMLVEIKCFPDEDSTTRDLYISIGQYLVYRAMLLEMGLTDDLYLAIPQHIYDAVFDTAVMRVVKESHMKLVIVDLETETIVRWVESLIW